MWNIALKLLQVTNRLVFFLSVLLFLFNKTLSFFHQCSSQSDPSSANQQVQLLLEEKQQLEAHNHQASLKRTLLPDCTQLCCALKLFQIISCHLPFGFHYLVVGVNWPSADREELLCRADSGRGSCVEGQNRAAVGAGN